MGEAESSFETNLIFTVNCSHAAEITIIPLTPPAGFSGHISEFYIQEFTKANTLYTQSQEFNFDKILVKSGKADIDCGKRILRQVGIDALTKIAVIHPGSGGEKKCWHIDNFLAVAEALCSNNMQVLFLLGPAEEERFDDKMINEIEAVARCLRNLSLTQVSQIMAAADLFLGNDSGITHLAGAMGLGTLAIFGNSETSVYKPMGQNVTLFTARSYSFVQPDKASQDHVIETVFNMLNN